MMVSRPKYKSPSLNLIVAREREALARKQVQYLEALDYIALQRAKLAVTHAYQAMQGAHHEMLVTRRRMGREYALLRRKIQRKAEYNRSAWGECDKIRQQNNIRVDALRDEAFREHQATVRCFKRASEEYHHGSKAKASFYSRQGREHRARRNQLNAEIPVLIRETKEAQKSTKRKLMRVDHSPLDLARTKFYLAKDHYGTARERFEWCQARRDLLLVEFSAELSFALSSPM